MMISRIFGYLRGAFLIPFVRNWKPFQLGKGFRLARRHGILEVGERAHIWPDVKISITGTLGAPAIVRIGSRSAIGDRTQIHACKSVEIGDRVMISWDVNILENNYHARSKGPIRIEDDVWIGCRAIILHGVTIGRGAVIGAGSVVTKDVPSLMFAAGNPAKVLGPVSPEVRH